MNVHSRSQLMNAKVHKRSFTTQLMNNVHERSFTNKIFVNADPCNFWLREMNDGALLAIATKVEVFQGKLAHGVLLVPVAGV